MFIYVFIEKNIFDITLFSLKVIVKVKKKDHMKPCFKKDLSFVKQQYRLVQFAEAEGISLPAIDPLSHSVHYDVSIEKSVIIVSKPD